LFAYVVYYLIRESISASIVSTAIIAVTLCFHDWQNVYFRFVYLLVFMLLSEQDSNRNIRVVIFLVTTLKNQQLFWHYLVSK